MYSTGMNPVCPTVPDTAPAKARTSRAEQANPTEVRATHRPLSSPRLAAPNKMAACPCVSADSISAMLFCESSKGVAAPAATTMMVAAKASPS